MSCFLLTSNKLVLPHNIQRHWEIITNTLSNVRWTPMNLIKAIDTIRTSSYVTVKEMPTESRFSGLLKFLSDPNIFVVRENSALFWGDFYFGHHRPDSNVKGWFLAHTVPFMVQLILDIKDTFPDGISILFTDESLMEQKVELTKKQCTTLLACSYFCAFHSTSNAKKTILNFDLIFKSLNTGCSQNTAKLCMLMNYFERCRLKRYNENSAIIIRRYHNLTRWRSADWSWSSCDLPLTNFTVLTEGSIDDAGCDQLHVDFANRWIGGGVLKRGSVQEEIMFSKCPELLTSIYICDVMGDNEAIVISGAEEYSRHKGYSKDLKFIGDAPQCEDTISRVAMDATRFRADKDHMRQYSLGAITRELNKAFVAFNHDHPAPGATVATGNWGCGAFGGHVQLKALVQWAAASRCRRGVVYYTFNEPNCSGLQEVTEFLLRKSGTVGQLHEAIAAFAEQLDATDKPADQLFPFILDSFE